MSRYTVTAAAVEQRRQAAVTHGATSQLAIAGLRAELDEELATSYPGLDPMRRSILADRCARVVMVRRFLDEKGGIVRDEDGNVWPVVDRLDRWEASIDRTLVELEAERREQGDPVAALVREGRKLRTAAP